MKKFKRISAFVLSMVLIMSTVSQDVYAFSAVNTMPNTDVRMQEIADLAQSAVSTLADDDDLVDVIDDEEAYAKAYYEGIFGKEEYEAPEEFVEDSIPIEEEVDDGIIVEDSVVEGVTATSGDYTYSLSGENATISKYAGAATSVTIPSTIDGYTVVAISNAFNGNKTIESVTIPNTVVTIGSSTFRNATALTKVSIPNTVTKIDSYAFEGCSALTSVSIPESVETISSYAFRNCTSISSITIPSGIKTIGTNAFNGIKKVVFTSGMTTIPANACNGNTSLESVVIPNTVTSIGNSAFANCDALVSMTIPDTVTSIGTNLFDGCDVLESVVLPKDITIISSYCFRNCVSLKTVSIPAAVEGINTYAFNGCSALTSVSMPDTLMSIGAYAFKNCPAISSITVPSSVTSIGTDAFSGIKKIVFATGMVTIPANACRNNTALESVVIPDTVTNIGNYAFYNCDSLVSITIPDTVTSLGSYLFDGCDNLESVVLSNAITLIPDYSFRACGKLKSITIPDTVTKVGTYAFANCTSLTSVVIPDIVTYVGTYVFSGCTGLKTATLPSGINTIPNYCFNGCTSIEEYTIPSYITSVGAYAFSGCTALKKIVIPDNVLTVGNYAFRYCTAVEDIVIGKNTQLGTGVFGGITFTGDCGDNATYNLNLDERTLIIEGSGSLKDYSEDAKAPWAKYATLVTALEISDDITSIGANTFKGMINTEYIILPENVTSIGANAFADCDSVEFVEIPASVTTVGDKAFSSCDSLTEVTFTGNAPVISDSFATSTGGKICVYYPETAAGWTGRLLAGLGSYDWRKYDDTLEPIDVVLTLDTSGSMSGRMTDLKNVTNNFIMKVGGIRNNTRIALVEYNSNATKLSDFTMNKSKLIKSVNKMKSTGNTEYLKALNMSDTILDESSCENRVIVMFSDGQPTDSTTKIYELAEKLREKYIIFTVGLGVSQSVVLETIAGSKRKFFLAANIDELVAAFANLSDFINRKDTTEITMKRNNIRFNIMTEGPFKFAKQSDEYVSIDVVPSVDIDPAKYTIKQGNKEIVSNTTGNFYIQPGKIFAESGDIILQMYDESGKELEKKYTLNICVVESFKVTYYLRESNGNWKVYQTDDVLKGDEVVKPSDPTDPNRDFKGWYRTKKASGFNYFDPLVSKLNKYLSHDIDLYGAWKTERGVLDWETEHWIFGNSGDEFCATPWSSVTNKTDYIYDIKESDFAKLRDNNFNNNESAINNLITARNNPWGGSCYGMSVSTMLSKVGELDINDFDNTLFCLADKAHLDLNALGDEPLNIESMINYYFLSWNIPNICCQAHDYDANRKSEYIGEIIERMKSTQYPVVIMINVHGANGGYHAVNGYDFTADEANGVYKFKVYDCAKNYRVTDAPYEVTFTKSGGWYYDVSCDAWNNDWGNTLGTDSEIFFRSALTVENILDEVTLLDNRMASANEELNPISLTTNYDDFTVSDGVNTAIVENGVVTVSGNIILKSHGNNAWIGAEDKYEYSVAPLTGDDEYTITPITTGKVKYITNINSEDIFVNIESEGISKLCINANGKVVSNSDSSVKQKIYYYNNNLNMPWVYSEYSANTDSINISSVSNNAIHVVKNGSNALNIAVGDGINVLNIDDINSNDISLSSDIDRDCIIFDNVTLSVIASKNYGYSVIFDTNNGNNIPSIKNVKENSKIVEPIDPIRKGYEFTGWYKDEALTTLWNFENDLVTKDTVLYAGWKVDPNYCVIVTFKMYNDKEEAISTIINSKLKLEECPEITGDDKTWYKDPECKKAWNFEKDVIKHNIVLYSVGWDKKDGESPKPTPTPTPGPTPTPSPKPTPDTESDVPSPAPSVDPHADDNKVVVKQKIDVSGMFDLSSLGKDEKLAGYLVTEGKKNASITKKGLLSPKKPGDITIEAYKVVKEGKKKVKKTVSSIKLVVVKPEFDKAAMVGRKPGQFIDITKLISIPMNQKVEWSASKSSAATMDDKGMVTIGNKSGKLTVIATLTNKDGKKVKIKGKLVIKLPKLTKSKLSIKAGKSAKLSVRNIVDEASQKITWSTSNAAVAVYDASAGKVVANGKGEAVITAEIEGVAYTCNVKVK